MKRKRTPVWVWFVAANAVVVIGVLVALVLWLSRGSSKPAVPPSEKAPLAGGAAGKTPAKKTPSESPPLNRVLSVAEVVELVDDGVVLITCRNARGQEIGFGCGDWARRARTAGSREWPSWRWR